MGGRGAGYKKTQHFIPDETKEQEDKQDVSKIDELEKNVYKSTKNKRRKNK